METATLGGGCFWCLEAVYDDMEGVTSVESGYMGGHVDNPDYHAVCTGRTGHVEVVQVTFDPEVTSYREILEVFFSIHDPTSMDRQGNDSGTQYRSVIFTHSEQQKKTAQEVIAELESEGTWAGRSSPRCGRRPPSTRPRNTIRSISRTIRNRATAAFVVAPKLKKFREKFAEKRRKRNRERPTAYAVASARVANIGIIVSTPVMAKIRRMRGLAPASLSSPPAFFTLVRQETSMPIPELST